MGVTDQDRARLRQRFLADPLAKWELGAPVEKDGTKPGGGGLPQPYDANGRYGSIGRVGVLSPRHGDPVAARMDIHDVLKTDPKWGERTLALINQVPGFENIKDLDQATDRIASNIEDVMEQTPPELEGIAKRWYPLGHEFDVKEANATGIDPDIAHVVTARLSPQKDWNHNLAMTRAFLRTYAEDPVVDYDTLDTANLLRVSAWDTKVRDGNSRIAKPEPLPSSIVGKRLSELDHDIAGELVRPLTVLMGENHTINIDGSPVVNGQGGKTAISWQSQASMGRAMQMLRNPTHSMAHEVLGSQHKIRSFYENLRDPHNQSGFDDVTIDTHALGMGVGIPWGSSERMINQFFSSPKSTKAGVTGVYPVFVSANRQVRDKHAKRFESTSELQAVTWEGQRALWPRTAKKKWVMTSIARIRSAEGRGDIGHAEARDMVEALRLQLPGVATGGAGAATPNKVTGLPAWVTKDL